MPVKLPAPREIATLMGLPFLQSALPISDTTTDPGLFGPDSVTWKVMREPMLILGGGRALLMQVAHPLVAEGALHHSVFEADPFGRLLRTAEWTGKVGFGTVAEAIAACRVVNRAHNGVEGELSDEDATARVAAGTEYSARDGDLARWVHATLVDTLLVTYEALVGKLPAHEADQFVREWNAVGKRVGVRKADFFESREEMTRYIDAQINGGPVMCGAGSLKVAETILTSPIAATRKLWPAMTFFSVGLLPPALRRQYGISWSPARQVAMRSMLATARATRMTTPEAMRISGAAKFARDRAAGKFEHGVA